MERHPRGKGAADRCTAGTQPKSRAALAWGHSRWNCTGRTVRARRGVPYCTPSWPRATFRKCSMCSTSEFFRLCCKCSSSCGSARICASATRLELPAASACCGGERFACTYTTPFGAGAERVLTFGDWLAVAFSLPACCQACRSSRSEHSPGRADLTESQHYT
jgi:hypothetical protein